MKSTTQIASDCNLAYNAVRQVIVKEEIIPAHQVNGRNFYDKWQQDYIHSVLYFSGVLDEITLESKINNEPEETFAEFKARTYGKTV